MTGIFEGIQKLWSGIQTIVEGIILAINFMINMVKSLFELVKLLGTTLTNAFTLIATLPTWLIAFGTATLSVAVLYLLVGRESGK